MWFLWIVIGLLIGLGGAYLYYAKTVKPLCDSAIEGQDQCSAKLAKVYNFLDSAHNAAWGPVGIREETKDELFNKLWEWAGLPQKGMPRG